MGQARGSSGIEVAEGRAMQSTQFTQTPNPTTVSLDGSSQLSSSLDLFDLEELIVKISMNRLASPALPLSASAATVEIWKTLLHCAWCTAFCDVTKQTSNELCDLLIDKLCCHCHKNSLFMCACLMMYILSCPRSIITETSKPPFRFRQIDAG